MATIQTTDTPTVESTPWFSVNWNQFVREHITRSWWLTLWLILLTYVTVTYTIGRLQAAPVSTIVILVAWIVTVMFTVYNELRHRHNSATLWLRNNLYSSITNIEITLLVMLLILAALFGLYRYTIVTASFRTAPATDYRATLVDVRADEYCFNIGPVNAAAGSNELLDGVETCFATRTFAPDLSRDDITAVTLGQDTANFCFDEQPGDLENGVTCFASTAGQPDFFEVNYTYGGANWGAVWANLTNLMVFRFEREELWRVWAALILIAALLVPSAIVYRPRYKDTLPRRIVTFLWLLSPIVLFIFLRGGDDADGSLFGSLLPHLAVMVAAAVLWYANRLVNARYPQKKFEPEWIRMGRLVLSIISFVFIVWAIISTVRFIMLLFGAISIGGEQLFSPLIPDKDWGGFLLTLIITIFAIVVSFPLGLALALGRRSKIRGIPVWITYPVALIITVWGLVTSTPEMAANARNAFEQVTAYWPLAVPILAYVFQRVWDGNVLAAFSTLYIEFIRGIPLITVLFLTIILFPIFLPPDVEILGTWRVMWGFTLFAAAYLAENVRGGLQAIPNGQYEAADSLGLSAFSKYRLIILPQALRIVIPAITNQYIGLFKDTTLVAIVGLLDILGVANAISAQPQWLGVRREAYLFIAVMYYIISALIAGYSSRLERRMGLGER